MKWPVIGLMAMGVVAALCAALLLVFLKGPSGSGTGKADAASKEVKMVVAKRNLPAMTVVTAEMVEERSVPKKEAADGAAEGSAQVIGKALMLPMVAGQPFTRKSFAREGTGPNVAAKLEHGQRALTVALNDYAGLDGLLYPGSVVDVLASFRADGVDVTSSVLLTGIQVLAIENQVVAAEEDKPGEKAAATRATPRSTTRKQKVTLLVDPRQAQLLQLAMEHGFLALAMRNPLDKEDEAGDSLMLSRGRVRPFDAGTGWAVSHAAVPALPPPPSPVEKVEKTVAFTPPPPQNWDVTIYRGSAVEVKSFQLPSVHTQP